MDRYNRVYVYLMRLVMSQYRLNASEGRRENPEGGGPDREARWRHCPDFSVDIHGSGTCRGHFEPVAAASANVWRGTMLARWERGGQDGEAPEPLGFEAIKIKLPVIDPGIGRDRQSSP